MPDEMSGIGLFDVRAPLLTVNGQLESYYQIFSGGNLRRSKYVLFLWFESLQLGYFYTS